MEINQLDQHTLDSARQLAALRPENVSGYTGSSDPAMALANAFGQSQYVLRGLIEIIERMSRDQP